MTGYSDLSDEEAIELGIEFIGMEVELPYQLNEHLLKRGLLNLVRKPTHDDNDNND